jgi:hypothetical protein
VDFSYFSLILNSSASSHDFDRIEINKKPGQRDPGFIVLQLNTFLKFLSEKLFPLKRFVQQHDFPWEDFLFSIDLFQRDKCTEITEID